MPYTLNVYSVVCQLYLKTEKQTKTQIISLQFWRSGVQYDLIGLKSRCWQGHIPSGGCTFHCSFYLLEAVCIPWLMALSSIFKISSADSSNLNLTVSVVTFPPLTWTICLPFLPCVRIGITQIISPSQDL